MTSNDGVDICFETHGSPSDPALLLVIGLTSQLVEWDPSFLEALVHRGFFVVVFDNRDVGLSQHFDGVPARLQDVERARREHRDPLGIPPYSLSDMASDGVAVLDALGIDSAHIAGISMGGMIVQTMAIEHPTRVSSLATIMSHTGEPEYGRSTPEANEALMAPPPRDRASFIEDGLVNWRIWSTGYHWDETAVRSRLERAFDRCFYPEGSPRQLAAVRSAPSRTEALRALDVPTVVIHGMQDTLITPSGGERTADLVPGARLLLLDGMGHDLPRPLWPAIIDAIMANAERAGYKPANLG
jgi:pimeloyl-ACP methyl ester carboxylesterase